MKLTKHQTEQTRCRHCGRVLRSPRSVATGYGPTCARKIRRATTATNAKPQAIEKARELIEQGGILPLRGHRVFTVVSSDGARTYKTHPAACTCPAGLRGTHVCYHRVAAQILGLAA
jgi:hypothetical protein